VARGGFAQDLSAGNLQGGVERERAMAEIRKAVALGTPGRKGQNWIEPIESLNGALFIHTEHSCMGWGLEVETDNVRRLGLEIGIIAGPWNGGDERVAAPPCSRHGQLSCGSRPAQRPFCVNSNVWSCRPFCDARFNP